MTKEKAAYVYGLFIEGQNTPFYVGISHTCNTNQCNPKKRYVRAFEHLLYPENDNERTAYITLHNNVEVKILFENLSVKEACEHEKELICLYGRDGIDPDGKLTNIAKGGFLVDKEDLIEGIRNSTKHKEASRQRMIEYNKSEQHRKLTAWHNSIHPKLSTKESKEKYGKSISRMWSKKSKEEKLQANINKSVGRAWNVLGRISGNKVNEILFNENRSKGSRLANTEPKWSTIIQKVGSVEKFLFLIETKYGKKFYHES